MKLRYQKRSFVKNFGQKQFMTVSEKVQDMKIIAKRLAKIFLPVLDI